MQEILPIAATGRKMDRNSCNQPHLTPVRRIKSTRRSLSGVYAFRGDAVAYESTLERDFLQRIDFNRNVVAAVSQPVCLDFIALNGRSYTYTPDFLVYFKPDSGLRPMLVEVKPEEQWRAKWREWLPKWKAAWRYASEQGWSFHIYDESRIRDQVLEKIRFLERFKRGDFAREDLDAVVQSVAEMGVARFQYLIARHYTGFEGEGASVIFHLLATRELDCDVSESFDDFLEVWVAK
ncbi:MAG: TnsA endonuclease N-terminal domain-containing protein [Pseudomonas farsensis]|uniref:TnsA endonuclease N-terminal domain-containing protein n=1 Tax=Pseudomonas farsensis TaxID=2745492 RepID=UPI003C7DEF9C